ncbi:uncharacterized protein [Halyomorpha halys]|uniref:uncharacterized protein n=1 Tax=Halyomorpha halys TaxID=286706 RepID=UPI0006D51B41
MGKKGRKTRWRKLPIPIGNDERRKPLWAQNKAAGSQRGGAEEEEDDDMNTSAPVISRTTFNEDEYTKITTPRQDMLFKKGYLGRKKSTPTPSQDAGDTQSADSVESEQYCCEEQMPQYMYPAAGGYMDQPSIYYMCNYEVYDPMTGAVTVVVGPAPQFPGPQPVLATLPCAPVPLQSVEWFQPQMPPPPHFTSRKKSSNSIDSQNWSGQSSESTCPPGSPQDPSEQCEPQPYMYPGYMFGPPVYNINGVNIQGVLPQGSQTNTDQSKRRKKRRRRRRGGVTDEGSESSCEEVCSLEAPVSSSSSTKTNSDSGIATDPCGTSGGQGSLSSLSNDEADKDNKSIPSEPDSHMADIKEERPLQEEKEETIAVTTDLIEEVEDTASCKDHQESSPVINSEDTEPLTLDNETIEKEFREMSVEENDTKEHCLFEEESTGPSEKEEPLDEPVLEVTFSNITEEVSDCNLPEEFLIGDTTENELIAQEALEFTELNDFHEDSYLEPELPPVAPPRRKKCAKVAEKLATRLADEIVADAISNAAVERWPITSAVTKWLEDSDDEIEEGEEATGQKNGEGNPFPVPYHSGAGTRVATAYDSSRVREMCDPIASVNKYYRLALPMKTGPGPFPCGICCIIQ